MSEFWKKYTAFCMILLLLLTAAGALLGTAAQTAAESERISAHRQTHHEPESIAENLPYTPSATFRFSSRQSRTSAPVSRIRPWTPAEFKCSEKLIIFPRPQPASFGQPDNVPAICTELCLCTSPVRAGPETIFFS